MICNRGSYFISKLSNLVQKSTAPAASSHSLHSLPAAHQQIKTNTKKGENTNTKTKIQVEYWIIITTSSSSKSCHHHKVVIVIEIVIFCQSSHIHHWPAGEGERVERGERYFLNQIRRFGSTANRSITNLSLINMTWHAYIL